MFYEEWESTVLKEWELKVERLKEKYLQVKLKVVMYFIVYWILVFSSFTFFIVAGFFGKRVNFLENYYNWIATGLILILFAIHWLSWKWRPIKIGTVYTSITKNKIRKIWTFYTLFGWLFSEEIKMYEKPIWPGYNTQDKNNVKVPLNKDHHE